MTFGPRVLTGLVLDRPFTATILAVAKKKVLFGARCESLDGNIARDSAGRVEMEYARSRVPFVRAIQDRVARKLFALDLRRKTYSALSLPEAVLSEPKIPSGAEIRDVGGLRCYRLTIPDQVEAWVSVDLAQVILENGIGANRAYEWRLHDIVLGEPAREKFALPSGFREQK